MDAPSGTLVKLYDVIKELRENVTPVYDRHERTEKREKDEVGIHSVRGGTIVANMMFYLLAQMKQLPFLIKRNLRTFCKWRNYSC